MISPAVGLERVAAGLVDELGGEEDRGGGRFEEVEIFVGRLFGVELEDEDRLGNDPPTLLHHDPEKVHEINGPIVLDLLLNLAHPVPLVYRLFPLPTPRELQKPHF